MWDPNGVERFHNNKTEDDQVYMKKIAYFHLNQYP